MSFLTVLAVLLGIISWGSLAQAQQDSPASQSPTTQSQPTANPQDPSQTPTTPEAQQPASQQPPDLPAQQTPNQTGNTTSPDAQAQPADQAGGQVFTGTVMKQGSKFVLQADSGTVYDIDHQDQVAKFEGKKVRVRGTLDANKTIHVQ